jgi:hypothetical protein
VEAGGIATAMVTKDGWFKSEEWRALTLMVDWKVLALMLVLSVRTPTANLYLSTHLVHVAPRRSRSPEVIPLVQRHQQQHPPRATKRRLLGHGAWEAPLCSDGATSVRRVAIPYSQTTPSVRFPFTGSSVHVQLLSGVL